MGHTHTHTHTHATHATHTHTHTHTRTPHHPCHHHSKAQDCTFIVCSVPAKKKGCGSTCEQKGFKRVRDAGACVRASVNVCVLVRARVCARACVSVFVRVRVRVCVLCVRVRVLVCAACATMVRASVNNNSSLASHRRPKLCGKVNRCWWWRSP